MSEAIEEVSYYFLHPPQTLTLHGRTFFGKGLRDPLLKQSEYKGVVCNAKSCDDRLTPFYKAPNAIFLLFLRSMHGITKTLDFFLSNSAGSFSFTRFAHSFGDCGSLVEGNYCHRTGVVTKKNIPKPTVPT
jgi:hypothetical protein